MEGITEQQARKIWDDLGIHLNGLTDIALESKNEEVREALFALELISRRTIQAVLKRVTREVA